MYFHVHLSYVVDISNNTKKNSDYLFCLFPDSRVSQEFLWSCGKVEFESEAKHFIHSAQEVQTTLNLLLNLGSKQVTEEASTIRTWIQLLIYGLMTDSFLFVSVKTNLKKPLIEDHQKLLKEQIIFSAVVNEQLQ